MRTLLTAGPILGLPAALFWVLVLVVAAVAELATLNLVSLWFAVAALIALLASLLGASTAVQLILFVIFSLAGFLVFIIWIRPRLGRRVITPTNADRIMGKEGVVTVPLDPTSGAGLIRVQGQIWSALSEQERVIPEGTAVRVVGIRGVKAIVEPVEEGQEEA